MLNEKSLFRDLSLSLLFAVFSMVSFRFFGYGAVTPACVFFTVFFATEFSLRAVRFTRRRAVVASDDQTPSDFEKRNGYHELVAGIICMFAVPLAIKWSLRLSEHDHFGMNFLIVLYGLQKFLTSLWLLYRKPATR